MIIAVTAHTHPSIYKHMITVMVAMLVAMHGFVLM